MHALRNRYAARYLQKLVSHRIPIFRPHSSSIVDGNAATVAAAAQEERKYSLENLIANNKRWAESMVTNDPLFFKRLEGIQHPEYLWIGCSDSRVPANTIVGLHPGEVFVHRNLANMVIHTDLNCLSVMQFAVDVLKVKHIIVCGHHGCGGVKAALQHKQFGLVDNWIRNIREVYHAHSATIDALNPHERVDALSELNVLHQVENVARSDLVQNAWARGQSLQLHAWVYSLKDGHVRRLLKEPISSQDHISPQFRVFPPKANSSHT